MSIVFEKPGPEKFCRDSEDADQTAPQNFPPEAV